MISSGFFKDARIGDRVIVDDPDDPWIVVAVDLVQDRPREGWARTCSLQYGDCPVIEPSCTRDGIEVSGWGDGWAIYRTEEVIDGHQVWELKRRGSDLPGDTE